MQISDTMDKKLALENWQYYSGNHQQFYNGRGLPKHHPLSEMFNRELNRIFQSYNVCGEIVDHYANALVGKPFSWSVVADDGSINQGAEQIFSRWLEWQSEASIELNIGDPLTNAVRQMLVTDRGDSIGTGYLRVYSPEVFSNLEPFKQVLFHSPAIEQVNIERNCVGIACHAEYFYGDRESETYTLLNNNLTSIESNGSQIQADYGGLLPVFGMNGKCLISDAVKRGQNAINRALTYKEKNLEAAGFIERIIINAQPPGQWSENGETGNLEFILDRKPIATGSNVATFITGMPIGDPRTPKGYTKPSISYRDPVSPNSFVESVKMDIYKIYHQAGLSYLIDSDLGSISGASRQSLRDNFLYRLGTYQRTIEATLNRLFSIVIKALATSYPVMQGCRPIVRLNLAIAPSINERQENVKDVLAGIMSIPTAIANNGLDVASELQLIRKYSHLLQKFDN